MPILFDIFSRLPGAKHERVAAVPAVASAPLAMSGTYDRITGDIVRPDLAALREALPYIHRKALDRAPPLWTPSGAIVQTFGIYNTPSGPAFSRCTNGSMSLYDRTKRWIRDLRFHAYYHGPVTGLDGKPDGRYTYERENCGKLEPHYVTRFCDERIGDAYTLAGSHAHGWDHALARHAEMAE